MEAFVQYFQRLLRLITDPFILIIGQLLEILADIIIIDHRQEAVVVRLRQRRLLLRDGLNVLPIALDQILVVGLLCILDKVQRFMFNRDQILRYLDQVLAIVVAIVLLNLPEVARGPTRFDECPVQMLHIVLLQGGAGASHVIIAQPLLLEVLLVIPLCLHQPLDCLQRDFPAGVHVKLIQALQVLRRLLPHALFFDGTAPIEILLEILGQAISTNAHRLLMLVYHGRQFRGQMTHVVGFKLLFFQ